MTITIEINGRTFTIDESNPVNIAIPLDFYGAQPNAYDVERATSKPCEAGELIGDTRRGGSCNFEQITFIPHCNGTHTECVGHITDERIFVNDCLKDVFVFAELISVLPEKPSETNDSYPIELNENDLLITRSTIENALQKPKTESQSPKSLIVRTLPNDDSKLSKTYIDEIPPFFSTEAIEFLNEIGIEHLLVDFPSIDRIFDEGKLSNHRIFWNVEDGKYELNAKSFPRKTVTELIYVSNETADGEYLLNLQIAPFAADASPSRPILFRIIENG